MYYLFGLLAFFNTPPFTNTPLPPPPQLLWEVLTFDIWWADPNAGENFP